MQNPYHVLLVEDDADQRQLFVLALETAGYAVTSVEDAAEAMAGLRDDRYDVVLTDWYLPDTLGDDLIRQIKQAVPAMPVMLMSSNDHVNEAAAACGADAWFRKTDGVLRLWESLRELLPARVAAE